MSSIMRWRNGLMALSVMAMAPVSHEVTNPVILRQDEPTCYPAIQHASRTLRRGGAPTASGLVLGREAGLRQSHFERAVSARSGRRWRPELNNARGRVLPSPPTFG